MKEPKVTKGEWFASGTEIVSMPSQCKITNRVSGWNYEEARGNAILMAASKELLETCIYALGVCNEIVMPTEDDLRMLAIRLEEAIKKAV